MHHWLVVASFTMAVGAGCAVEIEDEDEDTLEAEEPSTTAAAAYGYWRCLERASPYSRVCWRACKTSTRINWQFADNYYFNKVSSYGSTISWLTSNIAGQVSGSKYRTRNNTSTFGVLFEGLAGQLWNELPISEIPDC